MPRIVPALLVGCLIILSIQAQQPAPAQRTIAAAAASRHDPQFERAKQLFQAGSLDEALAATNAGLARSPNSVDGLNLLGMILFQQKQFAESEVALQKALKIDPRSKVTLNNLAITYVTQEKFDQAEVAFRKILAIDRQNRIANYNFGLLLLTRQRPKEAVTALQRVQPADSAVLLSLVEAELAAGTIPSALRAAEALSRKNPQDVRLHFSLGVALASKLQFGPAIRELEIANALRPRTPEILHDLGQAYLRNHELPKAQATLEPALELNRDSADTLYLLAQVQASQHRDVDALELLVRARKSAPENIEVVLLMARLSMRQEFYEDAIQLLHEGVKLDDKRPELHAALGESLFTVGKVDQALVEFRLLLKLDPSARSYAYMGLCQRHLGKMQEASEYFTQGLKLDAQDPVILFNLAVIARSQGQQAQAEHFLQRALKSDSTYADALFELGNLYMDEKRFGEAVPVLRRSAELSQKPAQSYYKLSIAERSLHQIDAADRDLKVFLTLSKNPDPGPYPLQNFFEHVGKRGDLSAGDKTQAELVDIEIEVKQHPDRPRSLYQLAEAYFKANRTDDAKRALAELDRVSGGDFRTVLGEGVLLARFRLYPEAIQYFELALAANPSSDEAHYNLSYAQFQTGDYSSALQSLQKSPLAAQKDGAFLALAGDTYSRLGRNAEAVDALTKAHAASPGNDQYCFSLALAQMRAGDPSAASRTFEQGLSRVPDSGLLYWGLGIADVMLGHIEKAEVTLKKAAELSPSREGVLMTLGIFYYETGQIEKAKQILQRYREIFPQGGMDVERMRATLEAAGAGKTSSEKNQALSADARREFYELTSKLADDGR
jgi:tetratricopeptide (TPR) repeat protein